MRGTVILAALIIIIARPVLAQVGDPEHSESESGPFTGEETGPAPADGLEHRMDELSSEVRRLREEVEAGARQNQQLELRLSEQEQQVVAVRDEATARPERVSYEAGKGLRFRPAPDRFELTLGGFMWVQYTGRGQFHDDDGVLASGETYSDGDRQAWTNEFSMNEMRLWLVADMGENAIVRAVFQPAMSWGATGLGFGLQDGYLELRLHPAANLRIGQSLVCYDWETNTAPPVLPIVGYSPMTRFFGHGRDLGGMLYGQTPNNRFFYAVGAFNGGGRNRPNDNRQLLVASMARVQILGSLAPGWGWSDLDQSREVNLTLGGGFTYDAVDRESLDGDIWQTNLHAHFRFYGISAALVMHVQGINGVNNAIPEQVTDVEKLSLGGLVHLGYVPWRNRLELIARFSFIDPDLEVDDDLGFEALGGFTFFLIGQHAELTAQYTYQQHLYSFSRPDTIAHGVQIQAQGWF